MASNSLQLSLSLKTAYEPKTITNLLKDLSSIENESKKLSVLSDYLLEHQEELSKVKASSQSSELSQCMLLLIEAIETLEEEMRKIRMCMESNGSSGQASLMEFLPTESKNHEDDQSEIVSKQCTGKANNLLSPSAQIRGPNQEKKRKSQLNTSQTPNPDSIQSCKTRSKKTPSLFMTMKGHLSESSGLTGHIGQGGLNLKTDSRTLNYHPKPLTQSIWKNKRRAWSPELHSRFVDALNLLGGIDVATPKQIKEVMQVEGLTNDQVKSHLQKFRLHYRRLPKYTYPAKQSAKKQNYWAPYLYNSFLWKPSTSQSNQPRQGNSGNCELSRGGLSSNNIDMGSKEGRLI